MNRYFPTIVFMVACCAYVVYAICNYQLFADIPEINAMCICLVAMVVGSIGIFDMFTTIREYFKAK